MKRIWKKEELEYLEENWGNQNVELIAKKLKRTVTAVRAKAVRLGLGSQLENSDYISFNALIDALGYKSCYSWMIKVAEKYNCPIKKILTKSIKCVKINDFWVWAEKHQDILNFKDFIENALGIEPDWVKIKRHNDRNCLEKLNRNRLWTEEEDNLLIAKVKSQRYTYSQLSIEFKRTENAIKRRLVNLKVPYRPIPRDNHIFWTIQENELLIKLYKEKCPPSEIAKKLNKGQISIVERIKLIEQQGDRKFKYNNKWTNDEVKYLIKYWPIKGVNELSLELNRSKSAIGKKASRIGLKPKWSEVKDE